MKTYKLSLVTALLLGSFALSNPVAHAAGTTNQTAKAKAAAKVPATAQARVDKLAVKLKLTPEQKAKLLPIFQEEIDKRVEIDKRNLAPQIRLTEREKVRLDFLAKIKDSGVLTDAQYTQWLALQPKPAKTKATTVKPKTVNPQTN
jgi:hypothetical protein